MIRFKGKYLRELGFRIGDFIVVDLRPGCITIKKAAAPAVSEAAIVPRNKPTKQARQRA